MSEKRKKRVRRRMRELDERLRAEGLNPDLSYAEPESHARGLSDDDNLPARVEKVAIREAEAIAEELRRRGKSFGDGILAQVSWGLDVRGEVLVGLVDGDLTYSFGEQRPDDLIVEREASGGLECARLDDNADPIEWTRIAPPRYRWTYN